MGSYGIGVGRAMAAVAETHHDDSGLIWPISIAPYEVVLTVVKVDHDESMAVAEGLYDELRAAGVGPGTIRLSVGLEDLDDLIWDLEQGFRQTTGTAGSKEAACSI